MNINVDLCQEKEQLMLFLCKEEHCEEKNLYMCFMDLEKVFDRRKVVECAMKKKVIPALM